MCGIAGMVGRPDREVVAAMAQLQAHRGPDDVGTVVLGGHDVALAHRRLSIIDLSADGHQPMPNIEGNLWITFNGEIYNYVDLRRELCALGHRFRSQTDTEVLLVAYQAWGERCLERLNGMFAFAIYDARRRRLFAARDQLGIKPFYYYHGNGCLLFASEIKALFASPDVPKEPDYAALATPARFQIAPYTGFKDIYKLPPGHSLIYTDAKLSIQPYWRLDISENETSSDEEATEKLDALLSDSVRLQMVADVPVGVFLSGGLDSSLVSALMRQHTTRDIHAFTIRFSDQDQKFERMPDDSYYARRVARRFNFQYHEFELQPRIEELLPKMVWHLDEPLSDPAAINTFLIAQSAREHGIVVLLNGMGGDEVFGGYRKHLACMHAELYRNAAPQVLRNVAELLFMNIPVATTARGLRTLRWIKRFLSFASLDKFERYLASDLSLSRERYHQLFRNAVEYQLSRFYSIQRRAFTETNASYLTRMCANDTRFFLAEHNLMYSDKATMAAGVESRPPLIDHRIVEFMFGRPPRDRIRKGQQKFLLKEVAKRYLPSEIVYRPKAPFGSPLRAWIRGPLAPMVNDLLVGTSMKTAHLYDVKYVRKLIERDRAGLDDHALLIWTLLTTELWYRLHFGQTQSYQSREPIRVHGTA